MSHNADKHVRPHRLHAAPNDHDDHHAAGTVAPERRRHRKLAEFVTTGRCSGSPKLHPVLDRVFSALGSATRRTPCISISANWMAVGRRCRSNWALRIDTLTVVMLDGRHDRLKPSSISYSIGYHGRRSASAALFRLSVPLHLRNADAGDERTTLFRCFSVGKAWVSLPIC